MVEKVRHVTFAVGDWLAAFAGLKVGAAAKGVYIDIIALCYDRGEPTVPMEATIERLAGLNGDNPRTIRAAVQRLLEVGKLSATETRIGVELEPKRVRMELERTLNRMRMNREAGANGGRKSGETRRRQSDINKMPEATASNETKLFLNPQSSILNPQSTHASRDVVGEGGKDEARSFEDRLLEVAKIDPARWPGNFGLLASWRNSGATDGDIIAGIERVAAGANYQPPASLNYFTRAIDEARRGRLAAAAGVDPPPGSGGAASALAERVAAYRAAKAEARDRGLTAKQRGFPAAEDWGIYWDVDKATWGLMDGWRPKPNGTGGAR